MLAAAAILLGLVSRVAVYRTWRIDGLEIRGETGLVAALFFMMVFPSAATRLSVGRIAVLVVWLSVMSIALFLCAFNTRTLPGFGLLAVGVALNFVVITANSGMPVLPLAIRAAGGGSSAIEALALDKFHVLATSATRLLLLADVLPLPGPPLIRGVLSIGDVITSAGVACIISTAPLRGAKEDASDTAKS